MPKGPEDKSKHIFEHGFMTYVIDYAKKLCWLIDSTDKEDPISALELQRQFPSRWFYRHVDSGKEYTENFDEEWTDHVENKYRDYIGTVVAGEDERGV